MVKAGIVPTGKRAKNGSCCKLLKFTNGNQFPELVEHLRLAKWLWDLNKVIIIIIIIIINIIIIIIFIVVIIMII